MYNKFNYYQGTLFERTTSTNKEIKEEIKELTRENDDLKITIDQIQNDIDDLEIKNNRLESEKSDLDDKAEKLCREIFDLKQNCSQELTRETMERYSTNIKALANALESQGLVIESLRSNLAKSKPSNYSCET